MASSGSVALNWPLLVLDRLVCREWRALKLVIIRMWGSGIRQFLRSAEFCECFELNWLVGARGGRLRGLGRCGVGWPLVGW